jgi:hypothetical protein
MNWLSKLSFEVIEADDKLSIDVTWDEHDPELAEWTSWDNELQGDFLIAFIRSACRKELALHNEIIEEMPEEIPSCGI